MFKLKLDFKTTGGGCVSKGRKMRQVADEAGRAGNKKNKIISRWDALGKREHHPLAVPWMQGHVQCHPYMTSV